MARWCSNIIVVGFFSRFLLWDGGINPCMASDNVQDLGITWDYCASGIG